MSELIGERAADTDLRHRLLATTSAFGLLACLNMASPAKAEDTERPTVWIELGAQLERAQGGQELYNPAFLGDFAGLGFEPAAPVQRPPRYALGGEGKISFEPRGSDWVFSAGVRYGRSNGSKELNQQILSPLLKKILIGGTAYYYANSPRRHLNTNATNKESHAVIDFQAGKDVGLGMFKGTSIVSFGVRFAQFTSSRSADVNGVPDFLRIGTTVKYGIFKSHHRYLGTAGTTQSFRGVGPSLSWQGEVPLLKKDEDSEISLDWGVNGAVLFGRQKVRGETSATGLHYKTKQQFAFVSSFARLNYYGVVSSYHHSHPINRSRTVVVPNIGGTAGVSWRYSDAKISLGYRADFFFGAVDGGIDTRKTYNQSFYGPFATISIGLGG